MKRSSRDSVSMFSVEVSDDGWSVADESALGSLLKSVERLVALGRISGVQKQLHFLQDLIFMCL